VLDFLTRFVTIQLWHLCAAAACRLPPLARRRRRKTGQAPWRSTSSISPKDGQA